MWTSKTPINQQIHVATEKSSCMPKAFEWREKTYRVLKIQECWRLVGSWWDGDGEKTYFRIECPGSAIFEILYDQKSRKWLLARVED
jgi:hypothetical protein